MVDSKNPARQQARRSAETAKEGAERTGLAAPSVGAVEKARNEGVTEAIKEDAKDAYHYATDGQLPGAPPARQFTGSDAHSNMIDGMLGLSPEALTEAVDAKAPVPLSEEQVANLLKLERAGQNRTSYVHLLCKRLGVKSPYEVTDAGPDYTNDTTNVTPIER
jgi:hypothetical protein